MKKVTLEILAGDRVDRVCAEAKEISNRDKCMVRFDFNGVTMTATPKKSLASMLWDYDTANMSRWHVGLSWKEKYETENKRKREELSAKLALCPTIELSDADGWQATIDTNKDEPYGEAVIRYAETWARLMQYEMSLGRSLFEVAEYASYQADVEGLTGAMVGCAGSILSHCWIHGKDLRRWHNKQYGIIDSESIEAEETNAKQVPR